MPRHDEAVAAVVAFSGDDRDRLPFDFAVITPDLFEHPQAGILHQPKRRDAVLLDGFLVQRLHLFCGNDFHGELFY
jgi:hypothetical protein